MTFHIVLERPLAVSDTILHLHIDCAVPELSAARVFGSHVSFGPLRLQFGGAGQQACLKVKECSLRDKLESAVVLSLTHNRKVPLRAPPLLSRVNLSDWAHLQCRKCDSVAVDGTLWQAVRSRPSESCLELSEMSCRTCCGCGDDAPPIDRQTILESLTNARPDACLVNEKTLLVDRGCLRHVTWSENGDIVSCDKCQTVLGVCIGGTQVELFAHCLSGGECAAFSPATWLAADLLEHFQHGKDAQRRFVLIAKETGRAQCLLQLINDDWWAMFERVQIPPAPVPPATEETAVVVELAKRLGTLVKVFYRRVERNFDDALLIEEWIGKHNATKIVYSQAMCNKVLEQLKLSTDNLPSTMAKKVGEMSVGNLQRINV